MKIFLLLYLFLFFGLAMVLPSYRVWKTSGVNPYKLGSSDSAHDYIGVLFRLMLIATAVIVVLAAFLPNLYVYLVPIDYLIHSSFNIIGVAMLIIALGWVLIAQAHMQKSWRIGVDEDVKTELIQTGLFKVSRNPIFLGMRIMLLGLFLVLPSAASLVTLIAGDLLIQIQVRLEEEFLTRAHGQGYLNYKKQVRRWL
ncbi:MAG: isoprenylcysteine carboxylmethyltransferase family protein [Chloroflexi bacterium]|nr:isoprenylcysteine carboxylmethyltransferase family protein [Chloroflexota bacterium]MDL1941052.1 isoprenylcysteine carboxylmethyltransferase family protein [Chloroflexi bacterium CFX2]